MKPEEIARNPAPVIRNNDLPYLFQTKRDALLNDIADFEAHVRAGTLGDYSQLGFLAIILQTLWRIDYGKDYR